MSFNIILATLQFGKLSISVCNQTLNLIGKIETNLNKFVDLHTKGLTTHVYIMITVGRPTKTNLFRRVRYERKKGQRKGTYTYEPSNTTAVDVNMNNTQEMVSHSP